MSSNLYVISSGDMILEMIYIFNRLMDTWCGIQNVCKPIGVCNRGAKTANFG